MTEEKAQIECRNAILGAHQAFDAYERRFASAMAAAPGRKPWQRADATKMVTQTKRCLGIRDEWIPQVRAETVRTLRQDGFNIDFVKASSWPDVVSTALVYVPDAPAGAKPPCVILCCGHGEGGKLSPGYQAMARRLARQGAMVVVPDNIGQGERTPMGHGNCVVPFACGISVQGLIVMETLGWIAWAKADPRVDPRRLAAIGNSGGGTLTLFLAALSSDLCAISSSGYPSTFEFIARKEKKHCHCNLLPGIVGQLEMWQLYGLFAPRPLFLFQGAGDDLFPPDIFHSTARKVRTTYEAVGADASFRSNVFPGQHPWDTRRRGAIGTFLADVLGMRLAANLADDTADDITEPCLDTWPRSAQSADDLARRLTGRNPAPSLRLWDVFPPRINPAGATVPVAPRGDTLQILAQYECFLADGTRTV